MNNETKMKNDVKINHEIGTKDELKVKDNFEHKTEKDKHYDRQLCSIRRDDCDFDSRNVRFDVSEHLCFRPRLLWTRSTAPDIQSHKKVCLKV